MEDKYTLSEEQRKIIERLLSLGETAITTAKQALSENATKDDITSALVLAWSCDIK